MTQRKRGVDGEVRDTIGRGAEHDDKEAEDGEDTSYDFAVDSKRLSWRESLFSDWTIKLGSMEFKVHRCIIGLGDRGSPFFLAAFNQEYNTSHTDLSTLLPKECHRVFETVLDHMYGMNVDLRLDTVVPIRATAHILQLKILYDLCQSFLRDSVYDQQAKVDACIVLSDALQLDPQGRERSVILSARKMLIRNMWHTHLDSFAVLPVEFLIHLLDDDNIEASEDFVFDLVKTYISKVSLSSDDVVRLWSVVRFAHVLPKKLASEVVANSVAADPVWMQTCLALAPLLRQGAEGLESAMSLREKIIDSDMKRRLLPRKFTIPTADLFM